MTSFKECWDEYASDRGHFHLTPNGWVRCDDEPYPSNRVETWLYEMDQPEEDSKEFDTLTRLWVSETVSPVAREALRARFGEPLVVTKNRKLVIQSRV